MANKVSSHLYELIYSLTSSERRYFKIYVANHIGKHNKMGIRLFDIIVRNEGRVIEKVEKKINFTEHPSKLKNHLYDLILKSLEAYHSKTSITIRIRKQISQIENLYNKALYEQCITLSKKTLKEAEKIDHQNFKIDILDWYMNALRQLEHKNLKSLKKELQVKQQEAINKLKLEKEFKKLNEAIFSLTKELGTLWSVEIDNRLKEIMDNPLLSDYSLATSYYSKSNFNNIHAVYYNYQKNTKQVNYYIKQNLLLFEDYPARKDLDQFNYITSLNNYSLSCSALRDYDRAEYYFTKMESVIPRTQQVEIKIFEYLSANRLDLFLRSGQLSKCLSLVDKIELDLSKYGKTVSILFKTVVHSNLCYLFFATKQYRQALKYNNYIIDQENSIFRSDIFRFARIMNLLIHYELEDEISIEYFYDATERFIKKQINIYNFENWFLSFFKSLIKLEKHQKIAFFKEKEIELINVLLDEKERSIISHFNILAWIRTKHENISIEKSIQEYQENNYLEYQAKRTP